MTGQNTKTCPVCHKENPGSANFCINCGHDFNKYISTEDFNSESYSKMFRKVMMKENRGWIIYIALILIVVLAITAYQLIPLILENLSMKNPVILYISATVVYLINLYTFQFKKTFQKIIYFVLLLISAIYSAIFIILIYNSEDGFLGMMGPLITIIMIFSPFIIERKNLSVRG
jgi:carbon starvation protein CstA